MRDSEPYTRETLLKRTRVLGEDHWDTLQSLNDMGLLLQAESKPDEAEPYLRRALEKRSRVLGEAHSETLHLVGALAGLLREWDHDY